MRYFLTEFSMFFLSSKRIQNDLTQHESYCMHEINGQIWLKNNYKMFEKRHSIKSRWPPHTFTFFATRFRFHKQIRIRLKKDKPKRACGYATAFSKYFKRLSIERMSYFYFFSINHKFVEWISCWFIHHIPTVIVLWIF